MNINSTGAGEYDSEMMKEFNLPKVKECFQKVFGNEENIFSFDGPYGEGFDLSTNTWVCLKPIVKNWKLVRCYGDNEDGYFEYTTGTYENMPFMVGGFGSSAQCSLPSLLIRESDRGLWEDDFPDLTKVST